MSLNLSPVNSENGGTPRVRIPKSYINEKDGKVRILNDMNLGLVNQTRNTGFVLPEGVFNTKGNRPTINSTNDSFFPNAKAASMLERGWVKSLSLKKGARGLIALKDGPEMEVEVIEGFRGIPVGKDASGNIITDIACTVKEIGKEDSESYNFSLLYIGREWNFYIRTAPVPFTPHAQGGGQRGSKKRKVKKGRKTRKTRKTRKMSRKA